MSQLPNYLQRQACQYKLDKIRRAQTATMPDAAAWIEANFYLYDTGQLMTLFDCQRRPLELALSRDEAGCFRFNTVLWSWPKKSAKSSVIAAVCDYVAETTPRASIKLVANDLKQADSRIGYYIRENIRLAQKAGRRHGIRITPSGYHIEYPGGSRIEMVPIDPAGEAGGNDDLVVYSELWGWKSKAHQRMWSEMTLSPNKFGQSQRWIDTYAGFTGESPVLEQLYETGVKQGARQYDDLEVYANHAAKLLAVWVTKPMFPWQTAEYYAEQAASLTDAEFRRMHRNEWSVPVNQFVPIDWWDACRVTLDAPAARKPVVLALDAAVSNDCFALVAVSRVKDDVQVRFVRKYEPRGTPLDYGLVEQDIRAFIKAHNVVVVAYDPYQLHDLATRLQREGLAYFEAFNQGAPRLIADKRLYDLIQQRRVQHDGDLDLRQHIQNAGAEAQGEKLRIVKRNETAKIDLAVALAMAADRAFEYNIG